MRKRCAVKVGDLVRLMHGVVYVKEQKHQTRPKFGIVLEISDFDVKVCWSELSWGITNCKAWQIKVYDENR